MDAALSSGFVDGQGARGWRIPRAGNRYRARAGSAADPSLSVHFLDARSLGVAVYEVGTVKDRFVAVDGGMSDNPRPATYGAAYTAVLASRPSDAPLQPMTIAGKHCESGDILIEDIDLPADLAPGDLIAIPCSGAYQRSAAGNYNLVTRPPVVAVNTDAAHVIVRRETEEDLLRLYP